MFAAGGLVSFLESVSESAFISISAASSPDSPIVPDETAPELGAAGLSRFPEIGGWFSAESELLPSVLAWLDGAAPVVLVGLLVDLFKKDSLGLLVKDLA